MRAPICGSNSGPSTSVRGYSGLAGSGAAANSWATTDTRRAPCSFPFRILNLYVQVDVAPGIGKSWTFTVRVNGVDSPLTVTISGAAVSASDSTHAVTVKDGDEVDLVSDPSGTPAAVALTKWYTETEAAQSFPLLGGTTTSPSTSAASYKPAHQGNGTWETTEAAAQQPVPIAGTLRFLRARCTNNPGTSKSWTFTLYKNGVSTGLTVTVSGSATTAVDVSHQVAVAAGDTLSLELSPSGTPASGGVQWCVEFVPATQGQSWIGYGGSDAPVSSAQRFNTLGGGLDRTWVAAESSRSTVIPAGYTVKALYAKIGTASAAAKSWDVLLRVAGASSAALVNLPNTTTGNVTGLSVTPADRDVISFSTIPHSTPAAMTGGVHVGAALSKPPTGARGRKLA